MTNIDATLAERGKRYGDFMDHATIAQVIQDSMRGFDGWTALAADQKQALTVIADKIARILNGDPNYVDNWHDIQGYAKLVEDRLTAEVSPVKAIAPAPLWIEHTTGARPSLPDGTRVEAVLRDGVVHTAPVELLAWSQSRTGRPHAWEIAKYRVIDN